MIPMGSTGAMCGICCTPVARSSGAWTEASTPWRSKPRLGSATRRRWQPGNARAGGTHAHWTRRTPSRSARRATAHALRYLTGELQALLEVVVLRRTSVLDAATRQAELDALLQLLAEVRDGAVPGQREHLRSLHTTLTRALPAALAFVVGVERVEQDLRGVVGEDGVALIAWTWQRRGILGPSTEDLLAGLPLTWRQAARVLLATWDGAARASSAVEGWHSIVRPHLAVHRTLSAGLLAVLAVWHNHRVFTRGSHCGVSPLQMSGMEAPTDWLVALGYPPAPHAVCPAAAPATPQMALAA